MLCSCPVSGTAQPRSARSSSSCFRPIRVISGLALCLETTLLYFRTLAHVQSLFTPVEQLSQPPVNYANQGPFHLLGSSQAQQHRKDAFTSRMKPLVYTILDYVLCESVGLLKESPPRPSSPSHYHHRKYQAPPTLPPKVHPLIGSWPISAPLYYASTHLKLNHSPQSS